MFYVLKSQQHKAQTHSMLLSEGSNAVAEIASNVDRGMCMQVYLSVCMCVCVVVRKGEAESWG